MQMPKSHVVIRAEPSKVRRPLMDHDENLLQLVLDVRRTNAHALKRPPDEVGVLFVDGNHVAPRRLSTLEAQRHLSHDMHDPREMPGPRTRLHGIDIPAPRKPTPATGAPRKAVPAPWTVKA